MSWLEALFAALLVVGVAVAVWRDVRHDFGADEDRSKP